MTKNTMKDEPAEKKINLSAEYICTTNVYHNNEFYEAGASIKEEDMSPTQKDSLLACNAISKK